METLQEKNLVRYPRVGRVNLLYLATLVLVALVGGLLQFFSASWGLIATEFLLILTPALLFVQFSGLPWRATLRWRRPTMQAGGLSLLAGLGLAPLGMWLAGITAAVLGYAPLLTPDFFPRTPGQAVLIFLGLAVAAPLCEEVLFRGVIQRGYERFGPKIAILSTGILFIFFHLSFFRIWAIWPIAFVLCFLAWRTDSLFASILAHFGYNLVSTLIHVLTSLNPALALDWAAGPVAALVGLLVALAALYWLHKRAAPAPEIPPMVESEGVIRSLWPVAVAALFFLVIAALEVVQGLAPGALAADELPLRASPWNQAETWTYELRNAFDEPIGQAECRRSPEAEVYVLSCDYAHQAYNSRRGSSVYISAAAEGRQEVRWKQDTLTLHGAAGSRIMETPARLETIWEIVPQDEMLMLSFQRSGEPLQSVAIPATALLTGAWPWRVQALDFTPGLAYRTQLAWPDRYDIATESNSPQVRPALLQVAAVESLSTPAGNFLAFKVTLEDESAWYEVDPPHRLLRYDDGFQVFVLDQP